MKDFKEWLSDNLRYVMLGFAVILVIVILVLAFTLLKPYLGGGNTKESNQTTETKTTESNQKKTEKTTDKNESQKSSETSTEKESQNQSDTTESTSSAETTKVTEAAAETQTPETDPATQAAEEQVYETEAVWTEPEQVIETPAVDLGILTMSQAAYIRQEPSYDGAILGQLEAGQTVTFLEDALGWYKVDANGLVGYVGARFLY